jgi:hypothetical protein
VDGEEFLVRSRPGEPGVYDLEWLSGPAGYGFTTARSDGAAMLCNDLISAIRAFLAEVDPDTGYLP